MPDVCVVLSTVVGWKCLRGWCCLCRAWHEVESQLTAADKRLTGRQRKLVGYGREGVW